MARRERKHDPQHLRAIVDMGSNGIRFSISNLQPPKARIMPTLYQNRTGISLYDAQYSASGERQPIDKNTIKAVIIAFKQFERTCTDFGVPKEHITVLATEATRTAVNSEEFRKRIKNAVGWDVTMLAKEEEGRVGGMGIASSLPQVTGLVMDLGGGSTQLSWLMHDGQGGIRMMGSGAVSMPYGAAAVSRRLREAEQNGKVAELKAEVQQAVKDAYDRLNVPEDLKSIADKQRGHTLYLSGGGFRGWGYVLMSQHRVQPYPIPVINGFKVNREEFMDLEKVKSAAASTLQNEDDEIFRVSDRRASQVPAVAFLINALIDALPEIKEVRFCQGGVREGYIFSSLNSADQAQHPLVVASRRSDPQTTPQPMTHLLQDAIPPDTRTTIEEGGDDYASVFTQYVLEAFANLMYYHSSHSKDLQASAALRTTTSGALAGVHGILHEHRMLLALLLCARWGGEVPPIDQAFKHNLEELIEPPGWPLWWINYLGAAAALIAAIYPAGPTDDHQERLKLKSTWAKDDKGHQVLSLEIQLEPTLDRETISKEIKTIEKAGKKKNRVGGKQSPIGYKVNVEITTLAT